MKTEKPHQQPAAESKTVSTILDCLLSNPYFKSLDGASNYLEMDWDVLPTDPKELVLEKEAFYLKPNESKSVTFVLVPNDIGYSSKTIEFRACPLGCIPNDILMAVSTRRMVKNFSLNYQCQIPTLLWDDNILLKDQDIFVDKEFFFDMNFRNIDVVPGFVFFKVIVSVLNYILTLTKSAFCNLALF